jgi:uncharacterized protein YlxW (UPF0749 family)
VGGADGTTTGERQRPQIALAIATGLVAFLLVTAWAQVRGENKVSESRRKQLAELVAARQKRSAKLERQLEALRAQIDAVVRSNARGALGSVEDEIDRIAVAAGTVSAQGPGITVTLADSAGADAAHGGSADFTIQDIDIQLVVNALWDAGAEAIAVNGQRIVGTSAIRSAGGAVLVNYKVLTSPYRIEAVGPAQPLMDRFRRSQIATRFRGWVDVYHLGFDVKRAKQLRLPGFAGSVRLRYAQPATG